MPPPELRVVEAEASIDVRLWARHYVAVLLELEGISVTPTAIAEHEPVDRGGQMHEPQ